MTVDLTSTMDVRIQALFEAGELATAKDVAKFLGVDEKTLRKMTAEGEIGYIVSLGKKRYLERHVRNFLERDPCQSTQEKTKPERRSGGTTSSAKVGDFSALPRTPQSQKQPRRNSYVSRALRRERKAGGTI